MRYAFTRSESGRGWFRHTEGDRPIHAASGTDTTPQHHTYPTGYDSSCGWCWLGAPHTVAAHALELQGVDR